MGIKKDEKTKTFTVFYSKRDPIKRSVVTRRRKGIKTKAEANRVLAELILLVNEKIKSFKAPKWAQILLEYEKYLEVQDYSLKTVMTYKLCLNAHTKKTWGERLVDSISGDEIRSLIKEKVGNKSSSHQKNLLKYIRGAFKFALEKNYIERDPTPSMKFKMKNKIKNVLTEEECRKLLNQAKLMDSEWYPIWATALYSGMRSGELYALTWDKVNLDSRLIKVDCAWNNKDGFKETKSGDDRMIEIAPDLLVILRELKVRNRDSPFVLPRIDKWDKGEQARDLGMFLVGLGLPKVTFHDLRATWATLMLGRGIAPIKVMAMAGWKDLKTMQHYIRKAGVDIRGITEGLSLHNPNAEFKILSFSKQ